MNWKSFFAKFSFIIIAFCILLLIVLVYRSSDLLFSNSLNDYFKINQKTSNYISFNYAGRNINNVYVINNPKIYSDFTGRHFVGDFYDFSIELSKDSDYVKTMGYDIILKDMKNTIDGKFIKVYLTDQNNNCLGNENVVPVYSTFLNDEDGKIIYSGAFLESGSQQFRLKVWISDLYKEKFNDKLAFQIKVKSKKQA